GSSNQRVDAAQVMVEEVERSPQREGDQPQAHLRQFHGHWVEIDAIDAALEDVPLEQVDVGQLGRIDGDTLLAEGFKDALPGALQGEGDRIDGELVEELEQAVGDEIHDRHQKVAAAHCRVED